MATRHILPLFLLASSCSAVLAADPAVGIKAPAADGSEPRSYVGEGLRLGLGYDSKTKLRGEYYQVLQEDAAKAVIGEGWVSGSAGGLKLNYHWLPQAGQPADNVRKLFFALDQNADYDRKLTLGGGMEYANWFWGASLSRGLSGRRAVSNTTTVTTENLTGIDSGGAYTQEIRTATTTRLFERAYDYGIGITAGHFYEPALLRLYTRLDHEWGRGSARQATFAIGVEKFFADTPLSLALNAEAYHKSGEFDQKQNDHRVNLVLRYEFGGKSYRPTRESRMVPAVAATAGQEGRQADGMGAGGNTAGGSATGAGSLQEAPQRTEMRMVKTTASMSADAFFLFDSVKMTPTALTALDGVIAKLKESGHTGNIHLTGHTCNLGPAAYNQKLSEKRALAVKDYLAKHGVSADSVIVEGKGEADPRYSNKTKESRAKNRRVDMEFVSYVEKAEEVVLPADGKPAAKPEGAAGAGSTKGGAANAGKPAKAGSEAVEWKREFIDSEPAWLRRALHNTVPHKQAVDVYREQEKTVAVSTGARNYVNRAPLAANDSFQVAGSSGGNLLDVLANDSDPDGDPVRIVSVQTPAHGSASISGNRISYAPAAGYQGSDSFSYTISDDKGLTASATVAVTVSGANAAPLAKDDEAWAIWGQPTRIDVLANDSDPDGDALTIVSVGPVAHGKAVISGRSIVYTSDRDFFGREVFTYTVSDGRGGTASATVRVTVVDP